VGNWDWDGRKVLRVPRQSHGLNLVRLIRGNNFSLGAGILRSKWKVEGYCISVNRSVKNDSSRDVKGLNSALRCATMLAVASRKVARVCVVTPMLEVS
jgi:hypothetical protein